MITVILLIPAGLHQFAVHLIGPATLFGKLLQFVDKSIAFRAHWAHVKVIHSGELNVVNAYSICAKLIVSAITYANCKMLFDGEIEIPKRLHTDGRFGGVDVAAQSAPLLPSRQHAANALAKRCLFVDCGYATLQTEYSIKSIYAHQMYYSSPMNAPQMSSVCMRMYCKHLCLQWSWCDETSMAMPVIREKCQMNIVNWGVYQSECTGIFPLNENTSLKERARHGRRPIRTPADTELADQIIPNKRHSQIWRNNLFNVPAFLQIVHMQLIVSWTYGILTTSNQNN